MYMVKIHDRINGDMKVRIVDADSQSLAINHALICFLIIVLAFTFWRLLIYSKY